jgi:hypothetical protein
MSRQQLLDMYQRQIALGGSAMAGAMPAAARAGLTAYQEFRRQHPGLPRAELSRRWAAHKMGAAPAGGRAPARGVRHCMEEGIGPSGAKRCMKYMRGPRASMGSALLAGARPRMAARGSALVGGATPPTLVAYQAFRRQHPGMPRAQLSAMWAQHKAAMSGSALVGGRKKNPPLSAMMR